jgi:toxin ParE1/3/4
MSMPGFHISAEAEEDIDEIAAYSVQWWGWRQADRYLEKLEDGFKLLAQNPSIGRACGSIRAGMRRFEIGRHVVFYMEEPEGLLIVRVLHQDALPGRFV